MGAVVLLLLLVVSALVGTMFLVANVLLSTDEDRFAVAVGHFVSLSSFVAFVSLPIRVLGSVFFRTT